MFFRLVLCNPPSGTQLWWALCIGCDWSDCIIFWVCLLRSCLWLCLRAFLFLFGGEGFFCCIIYQPLHLYQWSFFNEAVLWTSLVSSRLLSLDWLVITLFPLCCLFWFLSAELCLSHSNCMHIVPTLWLPCSGYIGLASTFSFIGFPFYSNCLWPPVAQSIYLWPLFLWQSSPPLGQC